MHFAHLAYLSCPNPFGYALVPFKRTALVSHLRCHLVLLGEFRKQSCFIHRVSERFLKVHMFSESHCMSGDNGVCMVRSGYHHCIDAFAHTVKHFAPILKAFCLGIVVESFHGILPIHVAKGYNVFGFHVMHVSAPHSAYTDARNVQFVARCFIAIGFAEHIARHYCESSRTHEAVFQELSS